MAHTCPSACNEAGVGDALGEQLEKLRQSLLALGARRLAALAAVGLTIFATIGFGSYYVSRPDMEVLYLGLSSSDVSRIGAALREAGIPFDVSAEGTKVFVRHGETGAARMLLAEKGLPNSASAGYELFDKLGSMSLTSFMQNVTRVRALEGEIARTIQAMRSVKAARVHIVLPDPGSFRRSPLPPSASVVIRSDAATFDSAAAIRHLVSAAVPGMTPEQVTVLNTDGTVLASIGDQSSSTPSKLLELEKQVGKDIGDNIRRTLTPFLGLGNYELSVTTRLNMDKRQTNETAYDPESRVERSVRTVKETGNSQNSGNKWSVSVEQNVPSDAAASKPGEQSKKSNERKEELTNFEVNSRVTATVSEGYRIENLAVAVVVNRKQLASLGGDRTGSDAIASQVREVERLVSSAAAIDTKRGDKITVAAVDFQRSGVALDPIPAPTVLDRISQQGGSLISAAAILVATVLVIWMGVRPAIRLILDQRAPLQTHSELTALPPSSVTPALDAPAVTSAQAAYSEELDEPIEQKRNTPQEKLGKIVDYNEEQAAAVLKEWIRGP